MSDFNKAEFLSLIDLETKKSERLNYCDMIDQEYKNLVHQVELYAQKINETESTKLILKYLFVVCGYAKEISTLQRASWNTSISGLTRSLLECYAYAKKLIQLYGSPDYEDYEKNLIVIDMDQDRTIYDSLKNDPTIVDRFKRDEEAETYIVHFEYMIKTYFPEKQAEITEANRAADVTKIIKALKKVYDKKYDENTKKHKMVSAAIQSNSLLAKYDGSEVLYRMLCHPTHNNTSSLEERSMRNGMIVLNNAYVNLLHCIQLSYYCMKDCLDEFVKKLEEI